MEGSSTFIFTDPGGKTLLKVTFTDDAPNMEAATVGDLRDDVLQRLPSLLSIAPKEKWVLSHDRQPLVTSQRVLARFPQARHAGAEIFIALSPIVETPPAAAAAAAVRPPPVMMPSPRPVAPAAPAAANVRESSIKAAKSVKALAHLDEDRLANFLAGECDAATLQALSDLKKPPSDSQKRGKGGAAGGKKPSARYLEWAHFYPAIKDDVRASLNAYAKHNGEVETGIIVEQELSLQDFARNFNDTAPLAIVQLWVQSANKALNTSQRFAVANCITLGNRLETARTYWDEHKVSLGAGGLHTLEDFYKFLQLGYTADYIRKLINIGRLGRLYPNLALISCSSVGEIVKFAPDFMAFLKTYPHEAMFWRTAPTGAFEWTRKTTVTAFEGPKKRRAFDFQEGAPDESPSEWNARGMEQLTVIIAEDAAAHQLEEEKEEEEAERQAEMFQDAIARLK